VTTGSGFERIAVVGLGLLGGSVAAGARARGLAGTVVGISRGTETIERARRRGVIDVGTTDAADGVRGAERVILATPVFAMAATLERLAPGLQPGAIVTDVGSVKAELAETLPGLLPPGVAYVGSHPMAGSHETGLDHARPDLCEGAACIVTPNAAAAPADVERVEAFWSGLGSRVLRRDPAAHDAQAAWISHAPHAVAFAFAHALAEAPSASAELRGGGFRDFTRIAGSDPELWADILVTNRKALAGPLQAQARHLDGLARAIEAADTETVHRFLADARDFLAGAAKEASAGGQNPERAVKSAAQKE
jgi:cyclohexadieny/prephenate dehydrogenase